MAKDVLDINWVLLYIPTYIFAVWDAYRTTVDLNLQYLLAARSNERNPKRKNPWCING